MSLTLTRCLLTHAERRPDQVFWRQLAAHGTSELTFAQLHRRAGAFAAAYAARGVAPGRVVLIFLPQSSDAVAALCGAILVGAVPSIMPCPSAKQLPAVYWPAHRDLLRRIGAHTLVSDRTNLQQMQAHGLVGDAGAGVAVEDVTDHGVPPPAFEADSGSVALLQHSSGTTALKKGVALSHRAIVLQVEAYAARLDMSGADRIVSWLPLYHDMGLIACTVAPLVLGQTVTSIDPFHWVARPVALFDAIQRHDAQFAWMPNFAFEHLVRGVADDYAGDLSGMRAFINCSEPCMADTFDRFVARFARLGVRRTQMQVCYAMAETVFAVSQTAAGEAARTIGVDGDRLHRDGLAADVMAGATGIRLLSAGRPLPGLDVAIMRNGREQAENAVGEVTLRGPMLFDGYFNDPQTTAERMTGGRYHTRDRGFLRDGELYILGREDDLLIVNGRNLHAHEVESLLGGIAGIKPGRAVAFGVYNDAVGSEELVVVAERAPAAGPLAEPEADLAASRAIRRAVYEQTNIEVKTCRIVDPGWLLKTTSGKIGRAANRAKHLQETAASLPALDRARRRPSDTLQALAEFIAEWFKQPPGAVGAETVAGDIEGWDSLAHSTMILGVEKSFGVRFADNEIFRFGCVGDLARRIDELSAAPSSPSTVADRVVYKSTTASIVRLGDGEGPDIVVFAGRSKSFGGLELMDFASVFAATSAERATKYFVTDHKQDWYVTCFDEVAARLNELSPKPKILFGNSMGGYAALLFAPVLHHVVSVLSLVPQSTAPRSAIVGSGRPAGFWKVRLVPAIRYCVLFGEAEDKDDKAHVQLQMVDPDRQRMIVVRNCGHNLAPYLAQQSLLSPVLECCVRPQTMADEIHSIVSGIQPSPEALISRKVQLRHRAGTPGRRSDDVDARVATKSALRRGRQQLPAGQQAPQDALARNFAKANVTRDGRLTLEQAMRRLPKLAAKFPSIDIQKNGYITLEDIRSYRRSLNVKVSKRRPQARATEKSQSSSAS